MKAKTKREIRLAKECIILGFENGKKVGREQVTDTICLILIGILFVALIVFASIGIDSLTL